MLSVTTPGRDRLTEALAHAPEHLRPLFLAVRDHGCDLVWVFQGAPATRLPKTGRPLIAVIGDDLEEALGPSGFNAPTIRRLIRGASAVSIVSSGPETEAYAGPARQAVLRRENSIIIETRPDQEIAWANFVLETRSDLYLLMCSPPGGRA